MKNVGAGYSMLRVNGYSGTSVRLRWVQMRAACSVEGVAAGGIGHS